MLSLLILFFGRWSVGFAENVHMTKVFILPIEPGMFNWTLQGVDRSLYKINPDLHKSNDTRCIQVTTVIFIGNIRITWLGVTVSFL
jgi:hypothetical protein